MTQTIPGSADGTGVGDPARSPAWPTRSTRTPRSSSALVPFDLPMIGIVDDALRGCDEFVQMLGGYGLEVHDPADFTPALRHARESGLPSLINVRVDPDVHAPGTMNQTMYK
ncbi:MAG TPA: hypothetical protein VKZ81_31560 [Pseudonocardia sp.]|jgi:hypothetical protein|uniref:hypothetical protein n=1 Tax=Pseudonocardia sp. TaxID=60912 RepID=UPI002B4B4A94|nr:hypothetical protein [Pseudonocardia sp.]HLU60021.1 hypothetical protein [Pseudonocardia sp.]